MPDLLHIVPVGDDTVLNWVLQGEDTTLGLSLITDVGVLLTHTDHDTLMTGAADDGGEDDTGSVVTGEASFAHTGPIVYDKGSSNRCASATVSRLSAINSLLAKENL